MSAEQVQTIYRIVHNGRVLYVGQSLDPWHRHKEHRKMRFRAQFKDGARFEVIRKCCNEDVIRIEGQIIRAYQKRGQCEMNAKEPTLHSSVLAQLAKDLEKLAKQQESSINRLRWMRSLILRANEAKQTKGQNQ